MTAVAVYSRTGPYVIKVCMSIAAINLDEIHIPGSITFADLAALREIAAHLGKGSHCVYTCVQSSTAKTGEITIIVREGRARDGAVVEK